MINRLQPHSGGFTQLYTENHRWLHQWLWRRLGCHADAADLAQDTFLRTWKAGQLDELREPRAYLCLIAKRVLCSFWRRSELERAYHEALATLPEGYAPSEEDLALLREALASVETVLGGLPGKVRQAFLLNRLEGLTHPQIAAQLHVSLSTVERWIKQAVTQCYLASLEGGA